MFKKVITLVSLGLVTVAIFGLYRYLNCYQYSTPVNVTITAIDTNGQRVLDDDSITKLKNAISSGLLFNNEEKLQEVFNLERTKYIDLITVISILLTVFTLYSIISNILAKEDFKKLEKELKQIVNKYEQEVNILVYNKIIEKINKYGMYLADGNCDIAFKDNRQVHNLDEYCDCLMEDLNEDFKELYSKSLISQDRIPEFSLTIRNFMASATLYAQQEKYIKKNIYDKNNNKIIARICISLKIIFGDSMYMAIETYINSLPFSSIKVKI
jgi:hypothetical protein